MKTIKIFLLIMTMLIAITLTACGGGGSSSDSNNNTNNNNNTANPDIAVTDSVAPNDDLQVPFGSITVNSTADRTVTITNNGTGDLIIGAISNPLTSAFSKHVDNCSGQTIAPLASCTVTIRFVPTAVAASSDSFDIPSNDPDENPVVVSISGTGVAAPVPDITVTDSVAPNNDLQVPFGNVTVSTSTNRTVTITNSGTGNLIIVAIAVANPLAAPFSKTADTCSNQTILPAGNCSLTLQFQPTVANIYNDSFNIPSNDPDEASVTVSVSGTGVAPPVPDITVTDSVAPNTDLQVPFGVTLLNTPLNQIVTITNNGNGNLNIGAIAVANPLAAPFSKTADTCSNQTILPAGNCSLTLQFQPTVANIYNDSFNIPSNDPDENPVVVSVSGTGVAPTPNISVSPTSLNFGILCFIPPETDTRSITIRSTGSANLNITSITVSGNASYSQTNNCPATLAAGSLCAVSVTFAPTSAGVENGTLTINSNAGNPQVSLTGSGLNCTL